MSNYTENALEEGNQNTAWAQVVNLVKDNWTLLDVGCSSGNLGAELIKKKSCTVDGIEIDAADAKLAQKKLRHVETLNIETSDNITKTFSHKYDAILLIDVIEHLVDPAAALKKLKPLLKPNGQIIFSIPNMAHVSVRLALLEGDFTYTQTGLLDKTHLHFYTEGEIKRVFSEAKYQITEFNPSSLQYPMPLYKEKLGKLGLFIQNKKQFLEMMEKTHGNIYQYVGAAKPTTKAIKQPDAPTVNPHERDHEILQKTFDGYKKHIGFLEKSVELKDDHIKNLEAIIEDLKRRSISGRLKRRKN